MNRTELVGRLGRNPEIRRTERGVIANLSIATKEFWRDGAGEMVEHTEWHQLVCFDRLAEIAEEFLETGSEIFVIGSLRTKAWKDKDNRDQKSTTLRVDHMQMLRHSPGKDTISQVGKSLKNIEVMLLKLAEAQAGGTPMVAGTPSLTELAGMIDLVRGKYLREF